MAAAAHISALRSFAYFQALKLLRGSPRGFCRSRRQAETARPGAKVLTRFARSRPSPAGLAGNGANQPLLARPRLFNGLFEIADHFCPDGVTVFGSGAGPLQVFGMLQNNLKDVGRLRVDHVQHHPYALHDEGTHADVALVECAADFSRFHPPACQTAAKTTPVCDRGSLTNW
jgi:hypothetical protein